MLKQRVITGVILAPIVLACIFLLNPQHFGWFIAAVVALAGWEWAQFCGMRCQFQRLGYAAGALFAIYGTTFAPVDWLLGLALVWWCAVIVMVMTFPRSSALWRSPWVSGLFGLLVLVPLWHALVFLRVAEFTAAPQFHTLWLICYVLILVWIADIGAYFAGKAWGQAKLAPRVSPGKSWAGAWGGLVAVALYALVVSQVLELPLTMVLTFVVVSLVVAIISIVGDLNESMFKRVSGLKDSSNLLPGHGGILDRIDSLTAAVPVFACLLLLFGWV